MSNQLVEFKLDDGSRVVFESSREEEGLHRAGRDDDEPAQATKKFQDLIQNIRPAAQVILDSLKEMNSPKEIQLEFGLGFSAKTGVVIASADSSVNIKVAIKWVNDNK